MLDTHIPTRRTSKSAPDAPTTSPPVSWAALLGAGGPLSPRYRQRYAILLAQLTQRASAERVRAAKSIIGTHPSNALRALLGTEHSARPQSSDAWNAIRSGSSSAVVPTGVDLDAHFGQAPELEVTTVPIHPSRHAHLLTRGHVALRWDRDSVGPRLENAARIVPVATAAGTSSIGFTVWDDYAIFESTGDHVWSVTSSLGTTLEDELRNGLTERRDVVQALRSFRAQMVRAGVVWQGFAPRNMFRRGNEIVLIDFEEVVDVEADPVRTAECLLWHEVFFADCLTQAETAEIFVPAGPTVPERTPRRADAFERIVLGKDEITFGERRELLQRTARIEGRHERPGGGVLFGHELGHFWGDFVGSEAEARIFRALDDLSDSTLAACLEVFEAAMEADVIKGIRDRAADLPTTSNPWTLAVAEALRAVGGERLAEARMLTVAWVDQVEVDPAGAVDTLLFRLGSLDECTLGTLAGGRSSRDVAESAVGRATEIGLAFLHDRDTFLAHRSPASLAEIFTERLPVNGTDLSAILGEVERDVVPNSVAQHHSRYLAFPDSANALAAISGSVLAKFLNQNLIAVDRSAPAATFVETQVITWLRELVGYDTAPMSRMRGVKDIGGLWTPGGHLSNHIAMLTALGRRFPTARADGLRALETSPTVVMAGPIAHYSHSDAAFHLGLGWQAVQDVQATTSLTTDPAAVERALSEPAAGTTPFMVVGVAGNCRTTGLDDLRALGEICRRYGVWFHVDACHGGSLLFSDRLKAEHLAGIELADSVSIDPHKGLFTPYPSSYVLFRDPAVLTQFSRHTAVVEQDDCWDLGLITPFLGSRGFESLATWMLLKHAGTDGLGRLVESRQRFVRYLQRKLEATGLFVSLNDVDFYRVAWVFCPAPVRQAIGRLTPENRPRAAGIVSRYTSLLNTALYESGQVCFDEHTLTDVADHVGLGGGVKYTVMAACPGNPLLEQSDLDESVRATTDLAHTLVEQMLREINDPSAQPTARVSLGGPAGWSQA